MYVLPKSRLQGYPLLCLDFPRELILMELMSLDTVRFKFVEYFLIHGVLDSPANRSIRAVRC